MERNDLAMKLETLVDHSSLAEIVDCLSAICELKADHIREHWQDTSTANAWAIASREMEATKKRLARRVPKL
jgi:hypothetical protein